MSFPTYQTRKNSGLEWVGMVPQHWRIAPLKAVVSYNDEVLDESTAPQAEILYIDISSVDPVDGIAVKEPMIFANAPSRARRRVRHGDVIVSTVRTYLRAIARVTDPEENLVVSTGFAVIRPRADLAAGYLGYLLSASYFVEQVIARSTGVSYPAINASELVAIPVVVPPLTEQILIAQFLDREMAKINALVEEQRRLIELLKEKRQAVISHAVTKGLNPHAPMKPSSVEWLGDVPSHWKVGKTGFYTRTLSGFAFPSASFSHNSEDTRLLRGINVGVGRIKWDETVYWKRVEDDELDVYELRAGDLVLGMDRPWISEGVRVAKITDSDLPCLLLQRVATLETNKLLDSGYLMLLLSSEQKFNAHFSPATTGVSVPHISPEQIGDFTIPIPPVKEQREITDYVADQSEAFAALTAEAQRAIDLLKERRTALISAAVTGKIDVRGLAGSEAA